MCPRVKSRSKATPKSESSKLWILLVGVNQYQDKKNLPSLQYSALDCQGLGKALKEATASLTEKEVIIHHDFVSQHPNFAEVKQSITRIIDSSSPNDTILFYFSGHGILDKVTKQVVLCLADTDTEKLVTTGLPLNNLLKQLSNCAASQQLVWLDACHSGGMTLRGTSKISLPNPSTQLVEVLRNKAAESKGFYALLSCDRSQQSWEFPELGHGVFTYYLMRGLRGEAADSQGIIEADALYQYVYYQTLRYIDKTNQQIRLINQQKSSRGERRLQSEFPLQTPKRIVEGFGKVILGKRSRERSAINPRQALIVDGGYKANQTTFALSQVLQSSGGFNLRYFPQTNESWSQVQNAIAACLNSRTQVNTALLYLRAGIEVTDGGESWLVFADDTRVSRMWLRKVLRNSRAAQQIVILDCPGEHNLSEWIEDLKLEAERGQCLIAANASIDNSGQFSEAILQTLQSADIEGGLPVAAWITQLQIALAGTGILPQVWLSGTQGVIEVLPPKNAVAEEQPSLDLGICPYMGLQAFDEDSAAYFYGRQALVQKLLNQVNHKLSLAVVGASGSGKSSLVQAGLIAQLKQGKQIPGSDRWWIGCFRPGSQPIKALAGLLSGGGSKESQAQERLQIEGLLYDGVEGFVRWLRTRSEPMVLLAIDQFEELFTLASENERQEFIELILGALKFAGDRFKLVFTIRADFVATCLEISELGQILQKNTVLVPPYLTEADYRHAIVKPAEQVGLKVESGLVEVLLQDLDRSAGDLPLLQFALQKLWELRDNGRLTLNAYQKLGGVKGALERQAQAVYDNLDEEAQDCARWIFLNLTQLGEGTEDTRRRITKSDLVVEKYPEAVVNETLRALTDAKLVVVNLDNGSNLGQSRSAANPPEDDELFLEAMRQEATVEVVHEILIRNWSSLRWWLEENRSRLRSQRQIEAAAILWLQKDKQDDFLLRGVRLAEAEEILIKYTDELSDTAKEYVACCIDARLAQQREAKKRLRKAQLTAVALGILGLAATTFGIGAYRQQLITQLENIDSLNAIAEAQLLSNQQLESVTTSVKAGKQLKQINGLGKKLVGVDNWQETKHKTTATLQQSIYNTQEINRLEGHAEQVNAIASVDLGGRHHLIATASDDETVKLWHDDGQLIQTLVGHQDRVTDVIFLPNYTLATASADKTIIIWKIKETNGKYQAEKINQLVGHQDWVTELTASPNGKIIASASRDGTIKLWKLDGELIDTLVGHEGWVNTVSFLNDKSNNSYLFKNVKNHSNTSEESKYILASGGEDNLAKIWQIDSNGGQEIRTIEAHSDRINDVKLFQNHRVHSDTFGVNPDKKNIGTDLILVSASDDANVKFWKVKNGSLIFNYPHNKSVVSVYLRRSNVDRLNYYGFYSLSSDGRINSGHIRQGLQPLIDNHQQARILDLEFLTTYSALIRNKGKIIGDDNIIIISSNANKSIRIDNSKRLTRINSDSYARRNIYSVTTSNKIPVKIDNLATNMFANVDWNGKISITYQEKVKQNSIEFVENKINNNQEINISRLDYDSTPNFLRLPGHDDTVSQIKYSPDGKMIASASWDKTIKLWNAETGELIDTLTGHKDGVNSIDFTPTPLNPPSQGGSYLLISGSEDKTIKIWDISDKAKLIKTIEGHTDSIKAVTVSPDGKFIASGGYDNKIKIWNIQGELLQTIDAHKLAITSLEFTPLNNPPYKGGGYTLVSASWDNSIKLWAIADEGKTNKLLHSLTGHQDGVTTINLNSDGTLLASGSGDRTIKLWNTKTGELIKTLRGHTSQINTLAFSNDDQSIISGEEQQGLFYWNLDLDNLLTQGCDRLSDYLSTNPNVKESEKKLCQ